MASQTITVANADNEVAGFTLSEIVGGTLTEASSGTVSFTIVLNARPDIGDLVILDISSLDTTESAISTMTDSLVFTDGNWNVSQTVNVLSVDDVTLDGTVTSTLMVEVNNLSPAAFLGVSSQTRFVSTLDNDVAAFNVSAISGTLTETQTTPASLTVVLDVQPLTNVLINLTSSDLSEVVIALPINSYLRLQIGMFLKPFSCNRSMILSWTGSKPLPSHWPSIAVPIQGSRR